MQNPWLDIPLSDYEGHMFLPQVGQAQMLADEFEYLLRKFMPRSVAILGCSGGNGFDRISSDVTTRVVGVDINPSYVEETRARFSGRFQMLELHTGDIQAADVTFDFVEMIFAALVFEYLDLAGALAKISKLVTRGGILGTIVQLPSTTLPAVTSSPFQSLQSLAPIMRLVLPEQLEAAAEAAQFARLSSRCIGLPSGKRFQAQIFRAAAR
jgi:ubiquinone/menaquinone biosynthesis C-methylase UbiE